MYLDVEHDHQDAVLAALVYSNSNPSVCDQVFLISQSGDKISTSLSFISVFSKLVKSIISSSESCQGDLPPLIFVPLKSVTIHNLLAFLLKGKLVNNDVNVLKEIFDAADILAIDDKGWSLDLEDQDIIHETDDPDTNQNIFQSTVEHIKLDCDDHCDVINIGAKKVKDVDLEIKVARTKCKGTRKIGRPRKNTSGRIGRPRKNKSEQILCPDCSLEFSLPEDLTVHYARHHTGRNSFRCSKCVKRFKSKHGLEYHLLSFHDNVVESKESCEECGNVFIGSSNIETSSAAMRKKVHEEMFHGDAKTMWVCNICSYKYSQPSMLTKHMLDAHTDDRSPNLKCSVSGCDKMFSNKDSRINHERTHDPSNFTFPCNSCERRFMQKSKLLVHQETHSPWRKCEICGEILQSKQKFEVHVQRCRDELKFQCETCGKKYTRNWKLQKHIHTSHTKVKLFKCEPCGKSFATKEYLHCHMKRQSCKKRSEPANTLDIVSTT